MQANRVINKRAFTWLPDTGLEATRNSARLELLRQVFGAAPCPEAKPPHWTASGLFDTDGTCVATLEVASIKLSCGAHQVGCAGIRLVAVHPDWRGVGLARDLMTRALADLDAKAIELVLLYAENADLYRRYGFEPVPQAAFVGPAPAPIGAAAARRLDLLADAALIDTMLATRAPLSDVAALVDAPALFVERIATDPDVAVDYLPNLAALVVTEIDGDTLVIVDIVAISIPSLAQILGALGQPVGRVKTLFPPDRLNWHGVPVSDDTGLMIRGRLPPALRRPFRLPPTTEF